MDISIYVKYWEQIYAVYSLWAIALVAVTFALMIPLNIFVKFCFKKATDEGVQQIRKTISGLLVFAVAIGVSFAYVAIVKAEIDTNAVLLASVGVGVVAMGVWGAWKLIYRLGLKKFIALFKSPIKEALKKITGIDDKILTNIFDKLVEAVSDSEIDNAQMVLNHERELMEKSIEMLSGFADSANCQEIASKLYDCLKLKFVKKNDEITVTESATQQPSEQTGGKVSF